jgi:hypothetical protein
MTESSTAFKSSVFAQETDHIFIVLITLYGSELSEDVRIASDPYEKFLDLGDDVYGVTSNSLRYIFCPFEISLPRDDKTGTVSARLSIQNIDRSIVEYARSVQNAINVKVQVVLSRDVNVVEQQFDNFKLSTVSYDSMTVEGSLTLDYWGLEPFPSGRFTPSNFPGLF